MRWMLATATLAAVAALMFGVLATRAPSGQASPFTTAPDRGGVDGALSYSARLVTPAPAHRRALQTAFGRAHRGSAASLPAGVREATHLGVLWAVATFTSRNGVVVTERFSRSRGKGWRDLGATPAACPAVPSELRSVWHVARPC